MNTNFPTLVLALYNRREASLRCLDSLSAAEYPGKKVKLVISIDNDDNKNRDILELAENYPWEHGEKEVIYHETNLGIRDHFNFCGDLTEKYGSVIFLEDDLFVSRYYYDYAMQALDFYKDDEKIAGISLFTKTRIEGWRRMLPFIPLDDGSDNFFVQQASSGQIWTYGIWKDYKKWYAVNGKEEYVNSLPEVPEIIKEWPGNSSWKKFFITYMILNNKYYVFPRISLITNFDDVGINSISNTVYHQSPLLIKKKIFQFSSFNDSLSIYDPYFEILPSIIKTLNPELSEFDFEVNLYGTKNLNDVKKELILSKSPGTNNIKQFMLGMKPHELNVVFNKKGNNIFLSYKEGLKQKNDIEAFIEDFVYFYRRVFFLREIVKIIIYKIKSKF